MKLTKFISSNNTPHINIPLIYSYCNNFSKYIKNINLLSHKRLNNKINSNILKDKGLFIISDWYNYGNLSSYSIKNIINELEWKIIIFKIIFTLVIIQDKYPSFRHNDLNINNILIKKSNICKSIYNYNNTIYTIPNVGYDIYINDFEYSNICDIIINNEIKFERMSREYGIRNKQNKYYDIHYFLNSLFFSHKLSENIKNFIKKYIPLEYLNENNKNVVKFRLIPDIEYTIPSTILKDDFFLEFITETCILSKNKYNFN